MSEPNAHTDGVGVTGKLLAGFPAIRVDLGTGMLAQMGLKQRIALRQPIPRSAQSKQGDERMLITLLACQNKPVTAARPDYSFQPAVTVDLMDERMGETFFASAITDERAREHGYATAGAMRKSLNLVNGQDTLLFSYGIRVANPVDMVTEDADKAGTRLVERRDAAYKVWSELPNEKTVRAAREYLETLPEHERLTGIALITPREKLNGLAPYAPEGTLDLNHAGSRVLPQEVAALRGLPKEALPPEKPKATTPKIARTKPPSGKLTRGDGWELISPPKEKKPVSSEKPQEASPAPSPVIKASSAEREARLARRVKKEKAVAKDELLRLRSEDEGIDDRMTKGQRHRIEPRVDRNVSPRRKPTSTHEAAPPEDGLNSQRER